MGKKQALLLLILTACCFSAARAQKLKPEGEFLTAGLKVGEPIAYSLRLRHPAAAEVLFPDSAYDFSPFELVEKYFFPTRTDASGESFDSAIYVLTTFETDSSVRLALPVFLLENKDTSAIRPPASVVEIVPLLPIMPDTVRLIDNTNYLDVDRAVNLPMIAGVLAVLLILAVILYAVFGSKIRKNLRLSRMKSRYERFLVDFGKKNSSRELSDVEHRLLLWKEYCERLNEIPFTSYTTKEIGEAVANEKLYEMLGELDRVIYGGTEDSSQMPVALAFLEQYAGESYEAKVKEIKNA